MSFNHFLIAHKVSGEPAFDVAVQMECPECEGVGCDECDDDGYWWIIPTSGHRAYPYWHILLDGIEFEGNGNYHLSEELAKMPPDLPDHYAHSASPAQIKLKLEDLLASLLPKAPTKPFKRR